MNRRRTVSCGSVLSSSTSHTPPPTISLKRTEAVGAFVPTPSASSSLLCVVDNNPPWPITLLSRRYRSRRHCRSLFDHSGHETDNEPPNSPTSSISSIPSFSRVSLYDETPSPASMSSTDLLADLCPQQPPHSKTDMKILYALEKKSKFCTFRAQCSTCGKTGSDFPRCGKCEELWCSRSCRLRNGAKHICSKGT